jgi:hypothetical protein
MKELVLFGTRDEIGSIKDSGSAPVLFALTPITIFAPASQQERLATEELLGGNAGRLFLWEDGNGEEFCLHGRHGGVDFGNNLAAS